MMHYLAEAIDGDGSDREPFHILLVLPETNVIFEGQHVKDRVQQADNHSETQEEGIAF